MRSISNKNKFLLQRLLDASSGFLLSFVFLLLKRKKRIIFNSTVNTDFTFNSKYLFLNHKDNLEAQGYEIKFVINDIAKREALTKKYGDYFISSKGLSNKCYILNAAGWIMSTMDPPIGGIFLNHNRFVLQLGHGTPIKNIGLMDGSASYLKRAYYKLMTSNVTYYLSPSDFFAEYIGKAFGVTQKQVMVMSQPRLESMNYSQSDFINQHRTNSKTKLVLYSPTWRPYEDVKLFPFDDYSAQSIKQQLIEANMVIFVRLHPKFEGDLSPYLNSQVINLNSQAVEDITEHLDQFDILLTDYSSIFCDFAMLNKPVGFIPYDKETYQKSVGFSFNYQDVTWGDEINSLEKLFSIDRRHRPGEQLNILNIAPNAQDIDRRLTIELGEVITS
ncbi:CDP-glycerol glycerophosphotransferase family protein [Photobacterium profundum]|uniref:CDP-glycerol glycerophosphotransferase family protein n=1 Tax=Photobacterium profundum TaxID=74109 RepID=UPI003D14EC94